MTTTEKEMQALIKRRSELAQEARELQEHQIELADKLGTSILAGTAGDKLEEELTKATAKRAGMDAAIKRADEKLNELAKKVEAEKFEERRLHAIDAQNKVRGEYKSIIAKLVEIEAQNEACKKLLMETNTTGMLSERDQLSWLWQTWPYEDLKLLLLQIGNYYGPEVQAARDAAKKG